MRNLVVCEGAKINLQMFADLDSIITANAQAFEGTQVKDQFSTIAAKLGELGYDVLLNSKKDAEFIPSSRMGEVITQREAFKSQVEALNTQLTALQKSAGSDEALKAKYQELMDANTQLLTQLDETKMSSAVLFEAKDAIDPNDVLAFIDKSKITKDAKGEFKGIKEEVERIRKAKPHLFGAPSQRRKAGIDPEGGGTGATSGSMNAMIRKAAGRG